MKNRIAVLAAAALALAACRALAYEWRGVSVDSRIAGRMLSAGYLRGKVVLLDVRDYSCVSLSDLRKVQAVWDAYRTKSFVAIGVHTGPRDADTVDSIRMLLAGSKLSYPVYPDIGLDGVTLSADSVYVIDSTCSKILFCGRDARTAGGVVGSAVFETKHPSSPSSWKRLIDSELAVLPGSALNRIGALFSNAKASMAFNAEYPEDAKRYKAAHREMLKNPEIKDLAKLVAIAEAFKDTDFAAKTARRVNKDAVGKLAAKYMRLKSSENGFVAQEAKNALADMTFAVASAANAEAAKDAAKNNPAAKKGKK